MPLFCFLCTLVTVGLDSVSGPPAIPSCKSRRNTPAKWDIREGHRFMRSPILSLAGHDATTPVAPTVSTHNTAMPLAEKPRLSWISEVAESVSRDKHTVPGTKKDDGRPVAGRPFRNASTLAGQGISPSACVGSPRPARPARGEPACPARGWVARLARTRRS